jgi:hypothetical protein
MKKRRSVRGVQEVLFDKVHAVLGVLRLSKAMSARKTRSITILQERGAFLSLSLSSLSLSLFLSRVCVCVCVCGLVRKLLRNWLILVGSCSENGLRN